MNQTMAAANPQPHITLNPLRRKTSENWPDFESLLRSLFNVGNIPNANRRLFLQLDLVDQALQFFRTLPQATRDDFDAAITALRNHYCNPNLRELHKIQLQNLKFDRKIGNPENFLVQVQIKATQAHPHPIFSPIPPANPQNEQAEIDRVQNAQNANQLTLQNAVNERHRRIKEIFTNAMPNFIKRKLLDQNETAAVQDLCTVTRRQMVFFELCPSDDWTRDAFHEVNSTLSENLIGALTKLTQQQDELKAQQTDLSNRINNLNLNETKTVITTRDPTKILNKELTTDLTTHEDLEDEETSSIEEEVTSTTIEDTIMATAIVKTTTTFITGHKLKNQRTKDI